MDVEIEYYVTNIMVTVTIGDKEIMNMRYLDEVYVVENMIDDVCAKFITISYITGKYIMRGWSVNHVVHGPVFKYDSLDVEIYHRGVKSYENIAYDVYGSVWEEMLADFNSMLIELVNIIKQK
jgi:hypothetical protein